MGAVPLQAAGLITGLIGMKHQEEGARITGAIQAHGARYEAAVTATQALTSAENSARTLEAKAEADLFNAKVAEQIGESEVQRTAAEATDFRRSQQARLASHRAKQAASGLTTEGSPRMVDESIFQEIEFGAARIAHGGQVNRVRAATQATLLKRAAAVETAGAKFAREAGKTSAENIIKAGELGAAGAVTAAGINATAARIAGIGQALKQATEIHKTITTMASAGFGGGFGA